MKNGIKKMSAVILSCFMAAGLFGCGGIASGTTTKAAQANAQTAGTAKSASGKKYKIGVLQLVQHTALDASNKGFLAALNDAGLNCDIDQQNAGGDQSACQTIATKLVNDKDDLILAIATPAAQAVAGATTTIPVLITAVTDPAGSKLVKSNEKPDCNVTGTSDLTPVKEQIALLKKILPKAKKVGILYCSAESNSSIQAKMAADACKADGLESKDYTVSSSNEIQQVVESMVGKVDAIYAPTDNVIAAGMTTVSMVANEKKIPVICGESGMVDNGGLATYGIDYYQLGYLCGQQAVKILTKGMKPAEMPIEYLSADKCTFKVNEQTAKTLGIDVTGIK
jgi:putative ABC transport system substrate-binding protein